MEEHNYSGLEVKYIGKEIGKGVLLLVHSMNKSYSTDR